MKCAPPGRVVRDVPRRLIPSLSLERPSMTPPPLPRGVPFRFPSDEKKGVENDGSVRRRTERSFRSANPGGGGTGDPKQAKQVFFGLGRKVYWFSAVVNNGTE
jgi:hypothetical protein